jgi:hypothetical protein
MGDGERAWNQRDVRQFIFLPGFHLLSHRLKVSLHSIKPQTHTAS